MSKVLISISNFYEDISKTLLKAAVKELEKNKIPYDEIIVPGAFELAGSVNIALESHEYSGVIALGCVIRGETSHFDVIVSECARAMQDIAIYYSIPMGFGVITVDNKKQANVRAEKYGENAALACIQMMKIKEQYIIYNDREFSKVH
jgi:6,7-dimethyl-8-ribityllumazine synthase